MDAKLTLRTFGICIILYCLFSTGKSDGLVTIGGVLVHIIDNCAVGNSTTCADGHCCTKKTLTYAADFTGDKPEYQLECKPLRQSGEFCYYNTPENFCPCATKCLSNGFFGSCL